MASLTQFTVLQDLPIFTGNPREGEPYFQSEIGIRNFLRAIENYFVHNNIVNDTKKLSVLYSLINKTKGDARQLVSSFAGKTPTFDQVKHVFLTMYPAQDVTDFRSASIALLDLKINPRYIFYGMTSFEAKAQAVAEAYINNAALSNGRFNEESLVTDPEVPAADPDADPDAPPPPPGAPNLTLLQVLHNFTMHLILANQLDPKIYKKLENFSPTGGSTEFMAATVKITEKYKAAQPQECSQD